jgi:hypothetical protein
VAYSLHRRLISRLVRNLTLTEIAKGEGIKGREGEKAADALEIAIALHYYRAGFDSVRTWLWRLFDKYIDIEEEVRRIMESAPDDKLTVQIRGALKMVIGQQGGKVTGSNLDEVTKQIVAQLRNGTGSH